MISRRAWLARLLADSAPCHALCNFNGVLLNRPANCAARPPGSTVKPIVAGLIDPKLRFRCNGGLRLGERRLDCVHTPVQGPLDLAAAISLSCNNWFAQASRRLDGGNVARTLHAAGAEVTIPKSAEELTLMALGLEGVRFTPSALAKTYGRLRVSASQEVRRGLAALANGSLLAGKTGTVREGGWFAGWTEDVAVAVFVAGGKGASDALPAARRILEEWQQRGGF